MPTPLASRLRVHALACAQLALCALLMAHLPRAAADDRPFLQTSNAVAEDDDEGNWALESWFSRVGAYRVFNLAPEYAFTPFTNLQFKAFTSRDSEGGLRSQGVETEFKHLFNHMARDGYGWGVHLSLALARDSGNGSGGGSGGGSGVREQSFAAKLIGTLPLFGDIAKLHVNAGLGKVRDERREWIGSVAFEHKLPLRTTAFIEMGREDRETLLHVGLRHWVKREKLAVDFSLQQQRGGDSRHHGFVVGVGWYDL